MLTLHDIFSFVCGQQNNWIIGGEQLPYCQRCTGLYAGTLPVLLWCLFFRPKATNRLLWVHGLFLLVMPPFGYHLVAQTGQLRMLTGQLFAWGLVYYLTLLPADRWGKVREISLRVELIYFAIGAVLLVCLQAAVRWGGTATCAVLSWLGFGGLLVYALLMCLNAALLVEWLIRDRLKHAET